MSGPGHPGRRTGSRGWRSVAGDPRRATKPDSPERPTANVAPRPRPPWPTRRSRPPRARWSDTSPTDRGMRHASGIAPRRTSPHPECQAPGRPWGWHALRPRATTILGRGIAGAGRRGAAAKLGLRPPATGNLTPSSVGAWTHEVDKPAAREAVGASLRKDVLGWAGRWQTGGDGESAGWPRHGPHAGSCRGRSGLRRAGCWLTASRGDPQDSATERKPPMAGLRVRTGKGERVR